MFDDDTDGLRKRIVIVVKYFYVRTCTPKRTGLETGFRSEIVSWYKINPRAIEIRYSY